MCWKIMGRLVIGVEFCWDEKNYPDGRYGILSGAE